MILDASPLDLPFWVLSKFTPLLPEQYQQIIHEVVGYVVNRFYGEAR